MLQKKTEIFFAKNSHFCGKPCILIKSKQLVFMVRQIHTYMQNSNYQYSISQLESVSKLRNNESYCFNVRLNSFKLRFFQVCPQKPNLYSTQTSLKQPKLFTRFQYYLCTADYNLKKKLLVLKYNLTVLNQYYYACCILLSQPSKRFLHFWEF